ncbi:MAG TPA: hypothetical protein VGG28_33335 [Kofleriaceae bacterium]
MLRRPWIALVIAAIVMCVLFARGRPDFVASDPLWYSAIAHQLSVDPASVFSGHELHPFVMRIGLTAPLALIYAVFGVSSVTTNLPALLSALVVLCVIFAAMPTSRAKLVGLAIGVLSAALLYEAIILSADLPCAALMSVSVLWLEHRDRPRGRWWLAAAAAAWLAAFLVKETAVWCAPVWIYAVIVDARRGLLARYVPALAIGGLLGIGYLWLCAVLWGDPFARIHGIDAIGDEHAWSLHGHPLRDWLARLIWQPPLLFAGLFKATLIPAIAAIWLAPRDKRIWLVALATFTALYWFGSTSVTRYVPLPISSRMALPILPPLLVCAGMALDAAIDWTSWRRLVVVVVAVMIALPSLRVMYRLSVRKRPEAAAFAELAREASDGAPIELVCGEPRCLAIAPWYFGYAVPPNLAIVDDHGKLPNAPRVRVLFDKLRERSSTPPELPRLAGDATAGLYDGNAH